MKVRDFLAQYFPPEAIAAAEGRAYDQIIPATPSSAPPIRTCKDGRCIMGVLLHESHLAPDATTPMVSEIVDILSSDLRITLSYGAIGVLEQIVSDNDHGTLATPGATSEYFDREVWDGDQD